MRWIGVLGFVSAVIACTSASTAYGQTKPAKTTTAKPKPAPPEPPPPPPDDPTKARVSFVTTDPTVQYVDLCNAPCTLTMPSGVHNVSMSKNGGSPITELVTLPAGPSTVTGTYVSRGTARGVLIVTGVFAILGGGVVYYLGTQNDQWGHQDDTEKIAGGAVNGIGWVLLIIGLVIHDQVQYKVTPGATARLGAEGLRLAW